MTQKIPERLEILDVMPRNPSGKVPEARAARPPARRRLSDERVVVQVSVTISGFTRLFGNDLRAVVEAARGRRRGGRAPARRSRPRGDGHAHRPVSVRQVPVRAGGAVARAAHRAGRDRGGDRTGAARDRHPDLAAATGGAAREDGGNARPGVARTPRPRCRHRLAARGVRRGRASRSPTGSVRFADQLRACVALWTREPPVSFESETVSFTDIWCEPRPVQAGGVPLSFGTAATPEFVELMAELGAGWLPIYTTTPEELLDGLARLRAAYRAVGRDPVEPAHARDAAPGASVPTAGSTVPRHARRRNRSRSGGSRWRASASDATSTMRAASRGSSKISAARSRRSAPARVKRSGDPLVAYLSSFLVLGVVLGMLGPALPSLARAGRRERRAASASCSSRSRPATSSARSPAAEPSIAATGTACWAARSCSWPSGCSSSRRRTASACSAARSWCSGWRSVSSRWGATRCSCGPATRRARR